MAARKTSRSPRRSAAANVQVHPVTPERWKDLVTLFGEKGACAGCWCLFFKQTGPEFSAGKGEANRRTQERHVKSGRCPGLLAYVDGQPAGWCAVEPREEFKRIVKSRVLKPVDERRAWSIPCFFVDRRHRGRGLMTALLEAACDHARAGGADVIEGYPVKPATKRLPDVFGYHGLVSAFEKAGFTEVARPSAWRRIMRRELSPKRRAKR